MPDRCNGPQPQRCLQTSNTVRIEPARGQASVGLALRNLPLPCEACSTAAQSWNRAGE
jgi:hypothetical protein